MSSTAPNTYRPDFVLPPGETILETLEAIGMTQAELAERTGKAPKTVNEIVAGKAPITPETAILLERVLRAPARFWLSLEGNYQEWKARSEEARSLERDLDSLREIPVAAMAKLGWIERRSTPVEQLQEVLAFFGVASPDVWTGQKTETSASFRRSSTFRARPGALAAWLRKGEIEGQDKSCAPFDATNFRSALANLRGLTREAPEVFVPEVESRCAAAGVAVVWVRELPGTHVSGATRWLGGAKALIQLSLRHKSDDHLWFTFFHEAGHILHHGKKDVFVDDGKDRDSREAEADQFAADLLIPPREWATFCAGPRRSGEDVSKFAAKIGVAPGIVVGRLQHERLLPQSHLNHLKRRFVW